MSDDQEQPRSIDDLIDRIQRSRAAFDEALAGLGDAELAAPLTAGGWSVADHVTHIAVWMDGVLQALGGRDRWAAMGADGPPGPDGFDALNERLRAPHAAKSPAEARAHLDDVHARMLARLRAMSIDELTRPYSHYQPDEGRPDADDPMLNWVVADTYGHYDEHRVWIVEALGRRP